MLDASAFDACYLDSIYKEVGVLFYLVYFVLGSWKVEGLIACTRMVCGLREVLRRIAKQV